MAAITPANTYNQSLTSLAIIEAARRLWTAWQHHERMPTFETGLQPQTIADGYAIQEELIKRTRLPVIGWKIGATNRTAQQQLALPGPLSGRLLAPFCHDSPATFDSRCFGIRALEPEVAFRLGTDLPALDHPYDARNVMAAIEIAYPALEIPDTRWKDWATVGAPAFIADNAAAGHLVLGPAVLEWANTDFASLKARLLVNEVSVEFGRGADVLDSPLNALAWLANHAIKLGQPLKTGDIVITGTCTRIGFADAGDRVIAEFHGFGSAEAQFN